jgi:transcription antitermination factor NusG
MDLESLGGSWFAIQVNAQREQLVACLLRHKGYECFTPRIRNPVWMKPSQRKAVEVPLYPGYVFCRLEEGLCGPIVTTTWVIRIVGNGRQPIPIGEQEMTNMQRITSSGLSLHPHIYMREGERIRITAGPLRGTEGILLAAKKPQQLLVSVELLQRSTAVSLDPAWVESAWRYHPIPSRVSLPESGAA